MKKALCLSLLLVTTTASAQYYTTPNLTRGGTLIPDYSQDHDFRIQPTYPATNTPDLSQGALRFQQDQIYWTVPGTNVQDYNRPSYIIQDW